MAEKQKKDIVICPKNFFFGGSLAEELAELRRYIIELAATSNDNNSASELGQRLFVLNYLIEDVDYHWDSKQALNIPIWKE